MNLLRSVVRQWEKLSICCQFDEDKTIVPSTAYTPTIVLVSDGLPTDINVENATLDDYMTWEPIRGYIPMIAGHQSV